MPAAASPTGTKSQARTPFTVRSRWLQWSLARFSAFLATDLAGTIEKRTHGLLKPK
jgi:hypothetical protein